MEDSKRCEIDEHAARLIRHKARQLIGKYGFTPDDYDDLRQEMAFDLLRRLAKFDPQKASLRTFVSRIIDRKVCTLIRYRRQEKRDCRRRVCPLDDPFLDSKGQEVDLAETLGQDDHDQRTGRHAESAAERLDLQVDLSVALSELPSDLRELAERLRIRTVAEVARERGISRSTLYRTGIARLRRVFENKGLREYL